MQRQRDLILGYPLLTCLEKQELLSETIACARKVIPTRVELTKQLLWGTLILTITKSALTWQNLV